MASYDVASTIHQFLPVATAAFCSDDRNSGRVRMDTFSCSGSIPPDSWNVLRREAGPYASIIFSSNRLSLRYEVGYSICIREKRRTVTLEQVLRPQIQLNLYMFKV